MLVDATPKRLGEPTLDSHRRRTLSNFKRTTSHGKLDAGLVCHRCGRKQFGTEGQVQCPIDGSWMVARVEHLRAPDDPYLGRRIGERYPVLGLALDGLGYRTGRAGQPLLVHILRPLDAEQTAATQRADFLKRAQRLAGISHPAVATVYDFGVEPDGSCFAVTEHVSGFILSDLLSSMGAQHVVAVCVGVLRALAAVHDSGVVHGAVSPRCVVSGFGERSPKIKLYSLALGKESGCVPPEKAAGLPIDHRADLYAVGAMLKAGIEGQTDVPSGLVGHIATALAEAPSLRFPDARAMIAALEAVDWDASGTIQRQSGLAAKVARTLRTLFSEPTLGAAQRQPALDPTPRKSPQRQWDRVRRDRRAAKALAAHLQIQRGRG